MKAKNLSLPRQLKLLMSALATCLSIWDFLTLKSVSF